MSKFSLLLFLVMLSALGLAVLAERLWLAREPNGLSFYGSLFGSLISVFSIVFAASVAYDFKVRSDALDTEKKRNAVFGLVVSFAVNGLRQAELYAQQAVVLADKFESGIVPDIERLRRHIDLIIRKRATNFEHLPQYVADNLHLLDHRLAGRLVGAQAAAADYKHGVDLELERFSDDLEKEPLREAIVADSVGLVMSFNLIHNAIGEFTGSADQKPIDYDEILKALRAHLRTSDAP